MTDFYLSISIISLRERVNSAGVSHTISNVSLSWDWEDKMQTHFSLALIEEWSGPHNLVHSNNPKVKHIIIATNVSMKGMS